MLRLIEVASQSENVLEAVAEQRVHQMFQRMAPAGHYCVVFSIDRPPLLAVRHHPLRVIPLLGRVAEIL